jgi:hypothetical protein
MNRIELPYVPLPREFLTLLKSNLSVVNTPEPIFEVIRPNRALYMILDSAFKEFDDGRGLEKLMLALGWSNFRDRMASLYVYKSIYGEYPAKTNMDLVDDIKAIETRFSEHAVHSYSRLFLLGFYLKLAQVKVRHRESNRFLDLKLPPEIGTVIALSEARSERPDWILLMVSHFQIAFGTKNLINGLISGKKFEELYELMNPEQRELMHRNLLAYGASIQEEDVFLYGKV